MEGFGTIKISDIAEIEYEIPSAWLVELTIKSPSLLTKYSGDKIDEIKCFDYNIKVGESITLSYGGVSSEFKIVDIEYVNKNRYRLYTTKHTKSKHFIMPCLGKDRKFWHYDTWLINCYLGVETNDLVLEYRFSTNPKYLEFEHQLRLHTGYFMTTEISHSISLYHYRIPDKHRKDIKHFLLGKYSNFSIELKNKIMSFHNLQIHGKTWQILYKDSKLKEQMEVDFGVPIHKDLDLYDIPNINEEILIL